MASFADIDFNFPSADARGAAVDVVTFAAGDSKSKVSTPATVDSDTPKKTSEAIVTTSKFKKEEQQIVHRTFSHDTGAPDGFEIFIGRMPASTTEQVLTEMAAPFEPLETRLISKTGKSGNLCGFVVFSQLEKANEFIASYNGRMMVGGQFPLNVRFADGKNRKKVFVGGLALGTCEDDLRALTSAYGTILAVKMLTSKAPCGFVTFATGEQAAACILHMHDTPNADNSKNYVVKLAKTPETLNPRRGRVGKSFGAKRFNKRYGYNSAPVTRNRSAFSSPGPCPSDYDHLMQNGFHSEVVHHHFGNMQQQQQQHMHMPQFQPSFNTQFNIPASMPVSVVSSAANSPTNGGFSGFGMEPQVAQFLSGSPDVINHFGQPVQQQQYFATQQQQQQQMHFLVAPQQAVTAPVSPSISPTQGFSSLSNDLFQVLP